VNNAVARTGGLLAVAAVPGLVGLTGDALSNAAELNSGFDRAMVLSACTVAAGGVMAALLFESSPLHADDETTPDTEREAEPRRIHQNPCPVDGALSAVGTSAEG
jgi:hypothetical protein